MLWWTVGLDPDAQACVETRGARQYEQSFSKNQQVASYFILFLTKHAISKLIAGAVLKCFAQPDVSIILFDCRLISCRGSVMATSRLIFVVPFSLRVRFFHLLSEK